MRADVQNARSRVVVCGCEMIESNDREVLSWDSDRRLAQIEFMRSLNGVGKARYGPAIRRSGDEIQTGGCEVGPENRAAGVVGAVGAETEGL
jgi:hypothetical protein